MNNQGKNITVASDIHGASVGVCEDAALRQMARGKNALRAGDAGAGMDASDEFSKVIRELSSRGEEEVALAATICKRVTEERNQHPMMKETANSLLRTVLKRPDVIVSISGSGSQPAYVPAG